MTSSTLSHLFVDDPSFGEAETLVFHSQIYEERRGDAGAASAADKQRRTSVAPSSAIDDAASASDQNKKVRWICIAGRKPAKGGSKPLKYRLCKVKSEKSGSFTISKTWGLDEVKSLESGKDGVVVVNIGKIYSWNFESTSRKIEFMFHIVTLSTETLKKAPKLVNMDEELLRDQMKMIQVIQEKERQSKKAAQEKPDFDEAELDDLQPQEAQTKQPGDLGAQAFSLNDLLSDFSWQVGGDATDLEKHLQTELQALEAANVHAIIESEEQADSVLDQIEEALAELSSVEEWLRYYTDLLEQMGQDVHQVEIKNKAMQIATSNRKLLLAEINSIQSEMNLPDGCTEVLRYEPFDTPLNVSRCEEAINNLMAVIGKKMDETIAETAMVTERRDLYNGYARQFCLRLADFLAGLIGSSIDELRPEKLKDLKNVPKIIGIDRLEVRLFQYRKLIQWLKAIDARRHLDLEMTYCQSVGRILRKDLFDFIETLLQLFVQRKVPPEEQDYLFSQQQVSVSSAATTAISAMSSRALTGRLNPEKLREFAFDKKKFKLTAARKTGSIAEIAGDDDDEASKSKGRKDLDRTSHTRASSANIDTSDLKLWPDEALVFLYGKIIPMAVRQQNFVTDLFSIKPKSEENAADEQEKDWKGSLESVRPKVKDIKVQNRLQELCESIFGDLRDLVNPFVESTLKYDMSFCVGMMVHVEQLIKDFEESANNFLLLHLENMLSKLMTIFDKFIVEQMKSIEDTKGISKKKSGILPFVRTFPRFVDRLESYGCVGQTRQAVSNCYSQVVKTIFDTLESVAKESLSDGKDSSKIITDDKDSLNVHILIVENMHFFYTEVRARKVPVLDQFGRAAKALYDQNLDTYVKIVMRKPLGRLLEFFEGIDDLLKSLSPEEISFHMQYSKSSLKDILKKFPGKEIRKGLEQLYKRVEKHFSEEAAGFLQVVWREIQAEYTRQLKRYEELIVLCYPESGLKVEFTMDDLLAYFSDLARMH